MLEKAKAALEKAMDNLRQALEDGDHDAAYLCMSIVERIEKLTKRL
jgi:hypothetical protein